MGILNDIEVREVIFINELKTIIPEEDENIKAVIENIKNSRGDSGLFVWDTKRIDVIQILVESGNEYGTGLGSRSWIPNSHTEMKIIKLMDGLCDFLAPNSYNSSSFNFLNPIENVLFSTHRVIGNRYGRIVVVVERDTTLLTKIDTRGRALAFTESCRGIVIRDLTVSKYELL